MKKIRIFFVIIVVLFLICVFAIFFKQKAIVKSEKFTNAKVRFVYEDENIDTYMNQEDVEKIKMILNKKHLYKDKPSCGFSDNVSIRFNDNQHIFCIACDECPIIYYKNERRYLKLSEKENASVRNILVKYGFHFPCL